MSLKDVCLVIVRPCSDGYYSDAESLQIENCPDKLPHTVQRYLNAFKNLPNKFIIDSCNDQGDLITNLLLLSKKFFKILLVVLGPTKSIPPLEFPVPVVAGKIYPTVALQQVCAQFSEMAVTIVDHLDYEDTQSKDQKSFSEQSLIELFGQSGNLLISLSSIITNNWNFSTLLLKTMTEKDTGFMPSTIAVFGKLENKPIMQGCLITQLERGTPFQMHQVK